MPERADGAASDEAPVRTVGVGRLLAGVGTAAGAVLIVIAVVLTISGGTGPGTEPTTVSFVVAAGTGERIDAGEVVELMPAEVRLSVGDTLELRNDDTRDHVIGPYFVRAGEVLSQTFTRAQELSGDCELNGEGVLRLIVA